MTVQLHIHVSVCDTCIWVYLLDVVMSVEKIMEPFFKP